MIRGSDVLSGREGEAFVTHGGNVEKLFSLSTLEATVELNKQDVNVVGIRSTMKKPTGMTVSGSMTIHYLTPLFRRMVHEYARTGRTLFFDVTVINDDAGSRAGRQTLHLMNCSLDSVVLAKLDAGDATLDEEVSFTAEGYDFLTHFNDASVYDG